MKLESVVPWGRSLDEYRSMFVLEDEHLRGTILGCGDGPASFNAEVTALGGSVTSIDPVYEFSAAQIRARIDAVYPEIIEQARENADLYIWDSVGSVERLGALRMEAMERFLSDFQVGLSSGRYIVGSLPELPFEDIQFDLALCSHFLFLYSEHVGLEEHVDGMKELCRVAGEVRVYPLVGLEGLPSPHVEPVAEALRACGIEVSLKPVDYRFQRGAEEMLVAKRLD